MAKYAVAYITGLATLEFLLELKYETFMNSYIYDVNRGLDARRLGSPAEKRHISSIFVGPIVEPVLL